MGGVESLEEQHIRYTRYRKAGMWCTYVRFRETFVAMRVTWVMTEQGVDYCRGLVTSVGWVFEK